MKMLQLSADALTRYRFATLVEASVAAAIYDIAGARRVRVWRLLPLGQEVRVAVTAQADAGGIHYREDEADIREVARPLLNHALLARTAARHGQVIERDDVGGAFRHAFPVGSQGEITGFVEVDGMDPALAGLYSAYRRRESWKLDLERLRRQMEAPGHAESMAKSHPLIRAVRAGDLAAALAALDTGADPNIADERGDPGLPLRVAAFNGRLDLIRLLVARGAEVNPPVRLPSATPMAMAVRGGGRDAVILLLELGASIPAGLRTSLSLQETLAAQGRAHIRQAEPEPPAATDDWMFLHGEHIEEIDLQGCIGVDTATLDAELVRIAMGSGDAPPALVAPPPAAPLDRFRFWKRKRA